MDTRLTALKNWLINDLKLAVTSIEVASADASFRRYFRIILDHTKNQNPALNSLPRTVIAMDSPPEHEDNALFANCTNILQECGLNAPTIFYKNLELGFLVIKDLGTSTYDTRLSSNSAADALYSDAMKALITMQSKSTINSAPVYSAAKLKQEMNLFEEWYIEKHHDSTLSPDQRNSLAKVEDILIENALNQEQVLVHRDFHCRNLLVTEENNPGIIDYQDMVIGPITYDLASIFKDCYIEWPREKVEQWVLDFQQLALEKKLTSQTCPKQWLKWFDLMSAQRHLKVLGIFCRLYYRDGKDQYLTDLHLTYKYLVNTCELHPELCELASILEQHACTKD